MRTLSNLIVLAAVVPLSIWAGEPLIGNVRDSSGSPVVGATVQLVTSGAGSSIGAVLAQTESHADGAFRWSSIEQSPFRIRVSAPGFAIQEIALPSLPGGPLQVVLMPESSYSSVTVSASPATRGIVEDTLDSAHVAVVRSENQLAEQPLPTLGHALANEPGILLQQSTWGQVSPFLRGLTGYQVLNLVDGIRFNNSTFRSGPNQYLAYMESSQASRVEAVLGPAGVAWGSDALGGAINVVTTQPSD